jgi:chemotaxis protein CheC
MLELTAMQVDALTEIVNIGVGRAASSLSDIIGAHILLKVPDVKIFPLSKLPDLLSNFHDGKLSSVLQGFRGDFAGTSALVFPPESALRLVTALTGNDSPSPTLDSLRSGTLVEVGNIVINAILGTMGNMLGSNFIFSLPEYREIKNLTDVVGVDNFNMNNGLILLAEANFNISSLEINGFIFILFKLESINNLVDMINHSLKMDNE